MTKTENLTRDQLINRVRGLLAHINTLEFQKDSLARDNEHLREEVQKFSSLIQLALQRAA
jgi:hypothetical protein